MTTNADVFHILTVTGFSPNSFDEAAKNAVAGAWQNHHSEFSEFVSYEVVKTGGDIEMVNSTPVAGYSATVAISAIHDDHGHDH